MSTEQAYKEGYNDSKKGRGILTSNYVQGSCDYQHWLHGFGHQKLEEIQKLKEENEELEEILGELRKTLKNIQRNMALSQEVVEKELKNLEFLGF